MTELDKVTNEIRQSYAEGRLIPFIGSGFSKPLGLPDWHALVGEMAEKVGYESELFFLHGNYQQLLEYLKSFHPYEWNDFIYSMNQTFTAQDVANNRRSSLTHQALAELDLRTIYTTNYDPHIELCLEDNNKKVALLAGLADFVRPLARDIDCDVIKFHGTLQDEKSIILTESQYFDRMALEEPVDQRLRSDLLSNSFLFIGYSFSDPNIRYIWYKIHKLKSQQTKDFPFKLRSSFYVTFGDEPIQHKLLENWDIKVVNLDPTDKTKSLSDFLRNIKG